MIDKVTIYNSVEIDNSKFSNTQLWHKGYSYDIDKNRIHTSYYAKIRDITIRYYFYTSKLVLSGRLVNILFHTDKVMNIDDAWAGFVELDKKQDINSLIEDMNCLLYDLFEITVDIATFKVNYIEICWNIHCKSQEEVKQYIMLFNSVFTMQNDKRYTNYAIRNKRPLHTSYYVKPTGEYNNKKVKRYNYTVNFYNKLDQLMNLKKKYGNVATVTDKDIEKAQNILRLEVQISLRKLKDICKKNRIDYKLSQLNTFMDIDFCCRTIRDIYCKFITGNINEFAHFCTYAQAKKIISPDDKELFEFIAYLSQSRKIIADTKNKKYKDQRTINKYLDRMINRYGIHFCFIPKEWGVPYLQSPMSMLEDKRKQIIENRLQFQDKFGIGKFDDENMVQIIDFRPKSKRDPRLKTPYEALGKDWWNNWVKE